MNKIGSARITGIIILVVSFIYGFHIYINAPPNGWRQSDCAAMAWHYYHYGNDFLHPQILHILNGDGESVGEMPILYFLVSKIAHIFGYHDLIFRGLVLLSLYLLLTFIYKISKLLGCNERLFHFPVLAVISIPLIALYGIELMPDMTALGFSMGGIYFYLKFSKFNRSRYIVYSTLFFSISALLKLHSILPVFAIGLYETDNIFRKRRDIYNRIKIGLTLSLPLITAFLWNRWAIEYNKTYGVSFFGVKVWDGWPIWEASSDNIQSTLHTLFSRIEQLPGYPLLIVLVASAIYIMTKKEYNHLRLIAYMILINLGFSLYIFVGLRDQDYYMINLMHPLLLFIAVLSTYLTRFSSNIRAVILVIIISNIFISTLYIRQKLSKDSLAVEAGLYDNSLRNSILASGVPENSRILFTPDFTPELSLYLLKFKGTTNFGGLSLPDPEARLKKQNVNYAVVLNHREKEDSILHSILNNSLIIGQYRNAIIYKLHQK